MHGGGGKFAPSPYKLGLSCLKTYASHLGFTLIQLASNLIWVNASQSELSLLELPPVLVYFPPNQIEHWWTILNEVAFMVIKLGVGNNNVNVWETAFPNLSLKCSYKLGRFSNSRLKFLETHNRASFLKSGKFLHQLLVICVQVNKWNWKWNSRPLTLPTCWPEVSECIAWGSPVL